MDNNNNNNNDQGDIMDTSSVGVDRLEEDGSSDIASTSTNDHHGSDKDIDDANENETSSTNDDDVNSEEVGECNGSTNKSFSSDESSSPSEDSSSDEEEGDEFKKMLFIETIRHEEVSRLWRELLSRDLINSNQFDSRAGMFGGLESASECGEVLRQEIFNNFDEEEYQALVCKGKEKGLESFIQSAIDLGYGDLLKAWPEISGYMGTSDKAAAGNNNGDGSSLGNSAAGRDGGSSIQQQQQNNIMRRTSLVQEQDDDDGDDATPQRWKRVRSPRSSGSSSSDINRLTQHCNSSSSHKEGRSDQGHLRRRRRRRLNDGTESPRQESEGGGALALENVRLRRELEKHQKKMATKEAGLKKKQQALAKGKELLNKKIAEEEARLLKAKEDAKAELDRLARDCDALVDQELKRRAKEKKVRLAAERLSIEYDKIRSLFSSLNKHSVAVASLREVEAVVCRLEAAFNPQAPNLSLIPDITRDLLAIHQNIAKFKKLITNHVTVQQTKDKDPLIDISLNDGIGTILSNIAKNVAARDKALNHIVSPELLQLMAAAQRFQTGKECDIPSELSSADSNELLDLFKSDQSVANLVLNCVHLTLMVWVESELSVEQLYLHLDEGHLFLRRATELHNQVRRGELFDPKMSLCRFREEAIIPAQNSNDEQLQQLATQVATDFANNLTLSGSDERKDIIRPVLQLVEKKKFDGSSSDVQDDGSSSDVQDDVKYFSEPGDKHNARRKACTCILFNASASELIEKRLPEQVPDGNSMVDLFPDGYLRALLINSSTFCKKYCNFVSPNRCLFKEGHLEQTAKTMYKTMKSRGITEEKKVIISCDEKQSLKRLFGMEEYGDRD